MQKSIGFMLEDYRNDVLKARDVTRAISTAIIEGSHDAMAYTWALVTLTDMMVNLANDIEQILAEV